MGCRLERLLLHFHIYKIIESGYCQINSARQTRRAAEDCQYGDCFAGLTCQGPCLTGCERVSECVCAERQEHIPCVHKLALLFCAGLALLLACSAARGLSGRQPTTRSREQLAPKEIRPCTDFIKLHSQLF